MKVLTAKEMGDADRRSVEAGVSISSLMEQAGRAVAEFCQRHYDGEQLIVVLCGKGNNGGDGMVAARYLLDWRRNVRVVLLGSSRDLSEDAEEAWRGTKRAERIEVREDDEETLSEALEGAGLIVDAVVGTGFHPPLRGLPAIAKELLQGMSVPVVAVDLPSGWDADSAEQTADAFPASAVVTFTASKRAHVFGDLTGRTFGAVVVAPIGTPEDAVRSSASLTWAGSSKELVEKPRDSRSNKGRFGHVLILGGAFGKAGAPSMASLAAMRAGAGLTTAGVLREVLPTVAAIAPELMCMPVEWTHEQVSGEKLEKLLKGITVVGIGPGMGTEPETVAFVREFVKGVDVPMVIDADALNAIGTDTALLKDAVEAAKAKGKPRTIVLTPHPGEMARLLGKTVKDVEADRENIARRFATEHGVTLVLKGWRTLIAHPDGSMAVNTTGNPAMAKGGSGDILTGIVSAMLAQYPDDVARAAEAAVFLHGLAGDFAALEQNEHTVLATDTVGQLFKAFGAMVETDDGLVWIAGLAKDLVVRGMEIRQ
jgi:NAD(P)H-hydrate epimerase